MNSARLETVIDEHGEHLLRMAFFYVRNRETAKDIVQEVFIVFYKRAEYKEQGKLRAYLTKMTVNRCKDYLKSWSFRHLKFSTDWIEPVHKEKDTLIVKEEQTEIGIAVLNLPVKYREVIIFYYYEEYKVREIAKMLSLSESTVKTRMAKARRLLKKELASDYWEVLSIE